MGRLGFAIASGLLLVSTSAYAQIGDITSTPTGSHADSESTGYNSKTPPAPGALGGVGTSGGSHYQTEVNIGDTAISFKSANVSTGTTRGTDGTTTVAFDFHNPTTDTVNFESTIIAAGLGFQVVSPSRGGCAFFNCAPAMDTSTSFRSFGPSAGGGVTTLGQVGFNFDISDNGESLYNVNGQFNLLRNSDGVFFDFGSLTAPGGAQQKLFDFHQIGDGISTIGFEWGATGVHFDLVGEDHHLTYTTSVFSYTNTSCVNDGAFCLVGYSGFGDPIGRGGGVEALTAFAPLLFADVDPSSIPGGANFTVPTFKDGTLSFVTTGASGTVPEPATWAMMILGFGGIGAALRRRRVLGATA